MYQDSNHLPVNELCVSYFENIQYYRIKVSMKRLLILNILLPIRKKFHPNLDLYYYVPADSNETQTLKL